MIKLGPSATETFYLFKEVYDIDCLSSARVFRWFKNFKIVEMTMKVIFARVTLLSQQWLYS